MESQSLAERRKQRMQNIRKSLCTNPAILATNLRLDEKIAKKERRNSIQIGDKELLLPLVYEEITSDDDEDNHLSLFHDKYTVGEKAGQGAHGVVKKCFDKITGEVFAVKTITLEREHILFLKKNFRDVKGLKHPHILTYKSLFFELKFARCYLLMTYVPSPDLHEAGVESEEELKAIVHQLLGTLKYIHQNKICHRDIKPENILYDRATRSIKIIDFGISKKVEDRGRKKEMLTVTGTPYYRAPEMFEGGGYDEMVDIWALGVTIFKLMTGYTPFESEYHSDTIANIMKGDLVFPEKLKFNCSQAPKMLVRRLVKRCKQERLTAETALKDSWFLDMKSDGDDELMKSMVLQKGENSFNPNSSANFQPSPPARCSSPSKNFKKGSKGMDRHKLFVDIEEETEEIFGYDETLKI